MSLAGYVKWLHTRWPAGTVEKRPEAGEDGSTNVPGLYVTGDLTGIPLLKFSLDTGVRAVAAIVADSGFAEDRKNKEAGVRDLAIVGAGVSGMAAAVEARKAGLDFVVFESKRPFQTIADFPKAKPIYTYPKDMTPAGTLQVAAQVKEALYDELMQQTRGIPVTEAYVESVVRKGSAFDCNVSGGATVRALRVIVAIGQSGNFRKMNVPGEESDKVYNRLHDPKDYAGQHVLVVGGGDSALETAIALAQSGADVTISYRKSEFSRPKPENIEGIERLKIRREMNSQVKEILPDKVHLQRNDGAAITLINDVVFSMIGREAPLDFFRRSGVSIAGEWTWKRIASLAAFLIFCAALYNWKSGGTLDELSQKAHLFPYNFSAFAASFDPKSLLGIALKSAQGPSFWYTITYSAIIIIFGIRRIRRRKTAYVRIQTICLAVIQILPLFLMPEVLLPWMDAHGWLPASIADPLFPKVTYGHGREFWRAYGLILAWPLNVYNVFTSSPLPAWLGICFFQTFVLIPALIYFYGKGAYCGWICSCGALAETLGDQHRHKMPHGPKWNRLNMAGQVVLAVAFLLLALRVVAWTFPSMEGLRRFNDMALSGSSFSYKWVVDVFLSGVIGYGVYFWYSGRFWCRFFCPLAALMHIYARFSRFGILADKKKCISCNVCTSVCHQGIDVMNFANKGLAMQDPECVRCSACVSSCPTGVLTFGQVDGAGKVIRKDRLAASLVQIREAVPLR